jgi:hypothetical protein
MYFVMQCASSKDEQAPWLRTGEGRTVAFVAHPELAPPDEKLVWAHPDAPSDTPGATWRQIVERNDDAGNPRGLSPAWKLYRPREYNLLVSTFGVDRTFILSAGWGLVRSDFPLPPYDITFVRSADPHKRRSTSDMFADFAQLRVPSDAPVVFLGGKDYLPFFHELTRAVTAAKIIPFRCAPDDASAAVRKEGEVIWIPYRTRRCTNWHYGVVEHLCGDPSWITASSA